MRPHTGQGSDRIAIIQSNHERRVCMPASSKLNERHILYWPESERPRERLLKYGPESLSEAALIAIFLRVGVRGMSAVDLARHLLAKFGGIRGLFRAGETELRKVKGLGTAKISTILAISELNRRYLEAKIEKGNFIECARDIYDLLAHKFRDLDQEVFSVVFLDTKHRVIKIEELFRGTIDSSAVYPREIVKRSLELGSSSIIAAHNHPSGNPEPSAEDRRLTRDLKEACRLMDITLLDHIVIGHERHFSFAEAKLI